MGYAGLNPMTWMDDDLGALRERDRLRMPSTLAYRDATHATLEGREVTVLCGNDYLGLRHHPALLRAANHATNEHGSGAGASRLVSGHLSFHQEVEEYFARHLGAGSSLLSASGYGANVGALAALLSSDDVVFSDALNHASLIDGIRLSRAQVVVVPHNDVDALRKAVRATTRQRRAWIVTESLFSMDGDLSPTAELEEIALEHGCQRYVDEAHAIGVIGPEGRGLCYGMANPPDVRMIGFGKALGGSGALLAGPGSLRPWLWNHSRSFIFSTGIAPGPAAAARRASELIASDPSLLQGLRTNIAVLHQALNSVGITTVATHPAVPILPVIIGDDRRAVEVGRALLERGYFVHPIRPPTVPVGTARLRITVSAAHDPDELRAFAGVLAEVLS
jgi:8-amino-7-oxononanoate synthase